MISSNAAKHLPFPFYYIPTLFLSVAGIIDSTYLLYSHYKNYTDITYSSFCAISKAINCDTVSQSPWSIVAGLPLALWGILAYLAFFTLLLFARKNTPKQTSIWSILFILAFIYSASAVLFGYISATKIHSYCILCLFSYGISFFLLYFTWLIRRRFSKTSFAEDLTRAIHFLWNLIRFRICILCFLSTLTALLLFFPHYWNMKFPPSTGTVQTGYTAEGNPWIGAAKPLLTIEEFTDYQCFQCAKMHQMLRRLINEHPGTLRLIHRHYPMDHTFNKLVVPEPFHVGSGILALAAIAAENQKKFWLMNDALYAMSRKKRGEINLKKLSEELGLDPEQLIKDINSKNSMKKLQKDIWQGLKYRITGTPTYVINGEIYQSVIPAEILKVALP